MREMPATYYRGYHYVINTAWRGDDVYCDAFSIHGPLHENKPDWSKTVHQLSISDAKKFDSEQAAKESAAQQAMAWIDQHQ